MRWIPSAGIVLAAGLLLVAAVAARPAAAPGVQALEGLAPGEAEGLAAQMRAVEGWRGTPFRQPVPVRRSAAPPDGRQGWYDAEAGVLTLAVEPGHPLYAATVTHELVHALQDQDVDLGLLSALRAGDASAALHAVAEAEALAGTEALLGFSMAAHLQPAADAPISASHAQLLFESGPARRWLDAHGGPAVALRDVPGSTAALLGGAAAAGEAPACGPAAGEAAGALRLWRVATADPASRPEADALAAAWRADRWSAAAADGAGAWGIRLAVAPSAAAVQGVIQGLQASLAPQGCSPGGAACPKVSGGLQPAPAGVDLCLRWSATPGPG